MQACASQGSQYEDDQGQEEVEFPAVAFLDGQALHMEQGTGTTPLSGLYNIKLKRSKASDSSCDENISIHINTKKRLRMTAVRTRTR